MQTPLLPLLLRGEDLLEAFKEEHIVGGQLYIGGSRDSSIDNNGWNLVHGFKDICHILKGRELIEVVALDSEVSTIF